VRGEALVHTPQGPLQCRCRDISSRGMSVVSPRAIKPRQRVHIESSFRGQRLVFDAMVVRRNRSREGHVLGMRFEGLGEQARHQLAELLHSMQVQAALAMQSCAVADRLPMLQLPDPQTERSHLEAQAPLIPALMASWPATTPKPGGTVEVPAMASATPQVEAPQPGGTDEVPAMAPARSRVATPKPGGTVEMPAMASVLPQAETPKPGGTDEVPTIAAPAPPAELSKPGGAEVPAITTPRGTRRPGSTMMMPAIATPAPSVATPKPEGIDRPQAIPTPATPSPDPEPVRSKLAPKRGGTLEVPHIPAHMGPEWGWTEDELVTSHYRPVSDASIPLLVKTEPPKPEPPKPEPPASLVDALELGAETGPLELPSAASTMVGMRLLEIELDEPPPSLDRTMLTPPSPELASFATTSQVTSDDGESAGWLGPARTGKTMVIHVQDLIAAYAPTLEPELDLPEPTAPITEPMPMPRLSEELQAALDRLRRRDDANPRPPQVKTAPPTKPSEKDRGAKAGSEDPSKSARRHRRRSTTQVYAVSRREDVQVKALYHGALDLPDPERGEGS